MAVPFQNDLDLSARRRYPRAGLDDGFAGADHVPGLEVAGADFHDVTFENSPHAGCSAPTVGVHSVGKDMPGLWLSGA